MEKTDEQLVTQTLAGDGKSFEMLVNRYLSPVYSFVFRLTHGSHETDDITQEVFLKVWKSLTKFNETQNFRTWIFTIARNTTFDFLRKKQPTLFSTYEKEGEVSFSDTLPDTEKMPDEVFLEKEDAARVEKILEMLSPLDREIVLFHTGEEMTFEEVALVLEIPMNTVKSRYRRALLVLKERLRNAPK